MKNDENDLALSMNQSLANKFERLYKEEKDKQALELADATEASYKEMKKLNYKFDKGKIKIKEFYFSELNRIYNLNYCQDNLG